MKRVTVAASAVLGIAVLLAQPTARADEAMAKKYNCLACHAVDHKVVGPAYKDVAKKYAGQADAVAKLSAAVKNGSTGVWGGPIPMPPNAGVPDADVKSLVEWILSLK